MLALCVFSLSKAVQVWEVSDYDLKQSLKPIVDGNYHYEAIDDFEPNELTELDWEYDGSKYGWWVMLTTPLVTPFFNNQVNSRGDEVPLNDIKASGGVMLAFKQNGDERDKPPGSSRRQLIRATPRFMQSREEDITGADSAGLHEFETTLHMVNKIEEGSKTSGASSISTLFGATIACLLTAVFL